MIKESIESLFDEINNSKEYKDYQHIVELLKNDKEVNSLINTIKKLEKQATKLEYEHNEAYREIDKEIEEKVKQLNQNEHYAEYLSKMQEFNRVLLASSSLLEEYITDKLTVE